MIADKALSMSPGCAGGQRVAAPPAANDDARATAMVASRIAASIALAAGRNARISLKLDPERHLRLRLACAIEARGAEALIVAALDAYLLEITGIEYMAAEATK